MPIATCVIKKGVCVRARVEATFPVNYRERIDDPEKLSQLLQQKCDDFVQFLRDHRSQDLVSLEVVRDYRDLCSCCEREWEADEDEAGEAICANCGAVLETEE